MAWIDGWRSVGGYFNNRLFSAYHGNIDNLPWTNPPGLYQFCTWGGDSSYLSDGVEIPREFWENATPYADIVMAVFDIAKDPAPQYPIQMVIKLQMQDVTASHARAYIGVYKRTYSDSSTYTDSIWGQAQGPVGYSFVVENNRKTDKTTMIIGFGTYNSVSRLLIGITGKTTIVNTGTLYYDGLYKTSSQSDFLAWLDGRIPSEESSEEFGPESHPEGYTGYNFDDHSDLIDMPTKPQSVLSLGFVNVYKCEANALHDFGAALFPEISFPSSLSDVGEVIAAVSDSIWNSKLIDYVISVHCVPGNVTGRNLEDIKVGARTMTGIMGRKITDEYVDIDFGSINTDQLFRNFADYMCQCDLWLPFYGFVSLKPEEWNGGTISVKYRINVIDGSFTAFVFATSNKSKLTASLIGEYGGSCVVHLPVSNLSYSSMFSSLIGGGAAAAMGIASGGASMVAGALAASNSVISAAAGGDTKKSNSYNASSSFMTRRKPYLIISAPVPSFSKRYAVENGLPSNVAYTLSQCKGYTVVDNPILDNIPCTADEKERIRNYLQSGVIIK